MFSSRAVGAAEMLLSLVNINGEPYTHHGELRHFTPLSLGQGDRSAILWTPGCDTITEHAGAVCAKALQAQGGLPDRGGMIRQILDNADHQMVGSYIPHCWASLRRWQEALKKGKTSVTQRELDKAHEALNELVQQMKEAIDYSPVVGRLEAGLLQNEINKVRQTQERLFRLSSEYVTAARVYGLIANQPEVLAMSLERWFAHPFNSTQNHYAMAPPDAGANDRAIAAIVGGNDLDDLFKLDFDSIS